jgi:hypothetical protein
MILQSFPAKHDIQENKEIVPSHELLGRPFFHFLCQVPRKCPWAAGGVVKGIAFSLLCTLMKDIGLE